MRNLEKPFWVEIGLWGIKDRNAALRWFYSSIFGSVLLTVISVYFLASFMDTHLMMAIGIGLILGLSFSLTSLWYGMCIYWMDSNRAWGK